MSLHGMNISNKQTARRQDLLFFAAPGYFFVISSFAVTQLKVPQLGGIVLYLGVCKALLDHTQILVSTVAVNISDMLPVKWRGGWCRLVCHGVVCGLGYLCSLPFITKASVC